VSLLATPQDYEPRTAKAGRVEFRLPDPTDPAFAIRALAIKTFYPDARTIAVWGCGVGSLVFQLASLGYQAFGFEGSKYAVDRAYNLYGEHCSVYRRNALSVYDVAHSADDAQVDNFDLLVTEDMLTVMSDEEIAKCLPMLRGWSLQLLHMVTPFDLWNDEYGLLDPRGNWKEIEEWRDLLAPDPVYDIVENVVW
jgi:hypothetical protein